MNVLLIFLLVLVPSAFTGPAQPVRRYFPEENDPDFKRFIYLENDKGEIEMVDLRAVPEGQNVEPRVALTDVEYDLYTSSNTDTPFTIKNGNVGDLSGSNFNPNKITMFVIHGWNNNRNSAVNTLIKEAVAGRFDINLFIVDWSGPANELYLSAKAAVVPIGQLVGNFINAIQSTYGIGGSSFVLVGHSLGAHVVGSAGATVTDKIADIIGLDPAGPLFSLNNLDERLDTTDGQFVQVIHTNGALLGLGSSIGDIDYYPNGGMNQPGCGWDLAGTCAHGKSYRYFAESLTRGPVFQAYLCSTYDVFLTGSCSSNQRSTMGGIEISSRVNGDYFLETNADEPYGQG